VSNWDPSKTSDLPAIINYGEDSAELAYLEDQNRASILITQLVSKFEVEGPGTLKKKGDKGKGKDKFEYRAGVHIRDGSGRFLVGRPSVEFLGKQLVYLRSYADLRDDRLAEILEQTDDLLSFFGAICHLDMGRRAHTLMLLDVVQTAVVQLEMLIKHHCLRPRPNYLASQVQPIIQTPDHSTYPSGHAMESFALATVIHMLMTPDQEDKKRTAQWGIENAALPFRLAARISANRTIAGVHYPVDSLVGAQLGCFLGQAMMAQMGMAIVKDGTEVDLRTALNDKDGSHGENVNEYGAGDDFLLSKFRDYPSLGKSLAAVGAPKEKDVDPILSAALDRALDEWIDTAWSK
jgi:membrane-associated phospholipid phosphatase